jgi:hypothetical protein
MSQPGTRVASPTTSRRESELELEQTTRLLNGETVLKSPGNNDFRAVIYDANGHARRPSEVDISETIKQNAAGPLPAWALIGLWIALSTAVCNTISLFAVPHVWTKACLGRSSFKTLES